MIRIDYYVFGYYKFSFRSEDTSSAASSLLGAGLSGKISSEGVILIPSLNINKYEKAFLGLSYEKSELLGLAGTLYKNRYRFGIFSALILVISMLVFASGRIWDIRIEGNEALPDAFFEQALSEVGFSVGDSWDSFYLSKVERDALEETEELAWININRRGTVAYVRVVEKKVDAEDSAPTGGVSNIVAECDCVIEEIIVTRGIAKVKAGEVVKKGQLLISGVIPAELGGGFVEAEGEVRGRTELKVSAEVARKERVKQYEEPELSSFSLKIFSFLINIYENYGNSGEECVIIEDTERPVIFGEYKIPFESRRIYTQKCSETEVSYTDSELVNIAASRLRAARVVALSDCDLLSSKTEGNFTDTGYLISCRMTVERDVGKRESIGG